MKEHYDRWFVHLPDGRVLNAKSTASVRHHVEAGNIPLNSMARRRSDDEWAALAKIPEFNDLTVSGNRSSANDRVPLLSGNGGPHDVNLKTGVSARLDPLRLQTVGIRGLVDELVAALDSTINSRKLAVASLAGIALLVVAFLVDKSIVAIYSGGNWLGLLLAGGCDLFILSIVVALLTRQTHLELSRMRPVTLKEAGGGLLPLVLRVFLSYVLTIGLGLGIGFLFQTLPFWLLDWAKSQSSPVAETTFTAIGIVGLVVALVVGHVILLSWLIAPILVVEECSVGDAIREWRALLKEHRVRVLVYEGMALALALIAALPVALPVYFALHFAPGLPTNWIGALGQWSIVGLATGPAIAFLTIANLFIYLNLRYEYSPPK